MITYVDTSVLVKLLVSDEVGAEIAQRVWMASDHVVCAEIGWVEARAALASAARAKRFSARAHTAAKRELAELWQQLDVVPVSSSLAARAGELAEQEGLRGYDAVHLAAAVAVGVDVVASADQQLLTAARRNHIDTADPTANGP